MDKRRNPNFKLLRTIFNILVVSFLLNATCLAGNLYVRVRTSDCSKTKLSLKLEGLEKLPASIIFSVKDTKTRDIVVEATTLFLQNGEYTWNGLIPFRDYTANVSILGSTVLLEDKFTNKNLLLQFLDASSRIVPIRNSEKKKDSEEAIKPSNLLEDVSLGSFSPNIGIIHLLLINSNNKLANQYLGSPIPVWRPTVPSGTYKLVVVEYYKAEPKCGVRSN
ncbi:MAG TPA: hypothetical protein VK892_06960 [Pyrinomonadaceae bacterium]|nr:hypothetical protein [Pyrinomonadaceae bacterium]